ncbi:imidazole glycerol phosphate synthase, glutamine amidotransferase subunit [Moorena producens PAL-8-15-08-1]|uniref:Imidazole glycerol phosphate synthase subunit HisH n=1 Tax=Moorena producens PAL-8-15-08-1 TaxID=1458985 RepID=A0A1D8U254_9CYAN|nr:imidazole glycerol phosphate synthase subunit HisH [Moorena producens]AOX03981.1 imidazole glycerol phosphate synthase, glutamine amidotransferase subunit [Moorena producens PAL-8-15-08-1]
MPEIGLIDYQAGNICSIANAFEYLGAHVIHVRSATDILQASHLVLPGVGAFGFCADRLKASGLLPAIEEWTFAMNRPILGICVGMQLFADSSDELGLHQGLGWVGGKVRKLHSSVSAIRIPHVGWNTVVFATDFGEYQSGEQADFYFDHSYAYHAPSKGQVLGTCTHGETFCAALQRDNLLAVQFHPEKSQTAGMRFLRSFLSM